MRNRLWKIWPNGLGASSGGWEAWYPLDKTKPVWVRYYPPGECVNTKYGKGRDADDAVRNAKPCNQD